MNILGIESSADETSAAVVQDGRKILSVVVASSMKLHDKTGGIIPESAAREQLRFIIPVIEEALRKSNPTTKKLYIKDLFSDIEAIAVTIGPGLNGSLLVGIETAKTLAFVTGLPIIPVNHVFAHLYANWLDNVKIPKFPAIGLTVSGGHTELFLLKSHTDWKWLGGTRDDAAGEAFDKTARLLGLGFPGGPEIAKAASSHQPTTHPASAGPRLRSGGNSKLTTHLPRPMIGSNDLDFSFSGLKTAVLREVNKLKLEKKLTANAVAQLSFELQESITDVLVKKTLQAARQYKVKSILLGGGVAANKRLTEKFYFELNSQPTTYNSQLYVPPPVLCTDNAAYIACYAYYHNHPVPWQDIDAKPDLEVEV